MVGDSTIHQILHIVHLIRTSWTKGNIAQGIFLDVSAAFDKCWHSGLLVLHFVDGSKSEAKYISAGVPQGSRLSLLYINDIIENLESETLLFADDTCLFACAPDPTQTTEILNRDLEKFKIGQKTGKFPLTLKKAKI